MRTNELRTDPREMAAGFRSLGLRVTRLLTRTTRRAREPLARQLRAPASGVGRPRPPSWVAARLEQLARLARRQLRRR